MTDLKDDYLKSGISIGTRFEYQPCIDYYEISDTANPGREETYQEQLRDSLKRISKIDKNHKLQREDHEELIGTLKNASDGLREMLQPVLGKLSKALNTFEGREYFSEGLFVDHLTELLKVLAGYKTSVVGFFNKTADISTPHFKDRKNERLKDLNQAALMLLNA